VWITKYRKPVLSKDVGRRLRTLIRQVCESMDIQIIKGHVSRDHVHIMVSVPPYITVSKMIVFCKIEFPTFARVNSPELQKPL